MPCRISLIVIFCFLTLVSIGQIRTIGDGGDYPTLSSAQEDIQAGDTLLLMDQIFSDGTQFLYDLEGTEEEPIVIMANPGHAAIFKGGTEAIHLVNCSHVEINGLLMEEQTGNGMNIDDGGDYSSPSHHITIRDCIIRNLASDGNNDLLKMSGVDSFLIENCFFYNGGDGGSGVDFVGCHHGVVQDCVFDAAGVSGIQNKGGTRFIIIQRNLFRNMSQRALNLGGSTGLEFFRPPLPNPILDAFEAADIDVFSNVFVGNWAPIAYVGCVRVRVRNNTFYKPENWVFRILQETTEPGFLSCAENEFSNNIIFLETDLTEVNIGQNTAPETFEISNNLWYNEASETWSPILQVTDPAQLIADPLFISESFEVFELDGDSPAIGVGKVFDSPTTDYEDRPFDNPPAIGALEVQIGTNIFNTSIETNFMVQPNPSPGIITIDQLDIGGELRLYNAQGLKLKSELIKEQQHLWNLSSLPAGTYLICNEKEQESNCQRIILLK